MKWIDGPRACTLTGHGGLILLAQISLDDNNRWNVYNFRETGAELASGGYSTRPMAKAVAENVVAQLERKEEPQGVPQRETSVDNQIPKA